MNPKTGRKTKRPGAPDDLTVMHAPHPRIIDDKLWEAVNRVCRDRGISKFDSGGWRLVMPRKDWLLAGMLCCGARGGDMIVVNSERVASATARARGPTSKTCSLLKSYGNRWLGDPAFTPVLDELNRRKAVVYVHRSAPLCCASLMAYVAPWGTFIAIWTTLRRGSSSVPPRFRRRSPRMGTMIHYSMSPSNRSPEPRLPLLCHPGRAPAGARAGIHEPLPCG